ncbi:MAG: protein translocase subunit SecD [Firmicutes bacterium]|nr:protein translocase subunit SecD [Bacillota bacterium]
MKKKSVLLLALMVIIAIVLNYVAFIGFNVAGFNYGGVFDKDKGIRKGIDLAGGSVITFQASKDNPTDQEMSIVESIFNARMNNAGYTETRISKGNNGQITVEIPSVTDTDTAASLLGSTAKLTFQDADGNVVLDGATDIKGAEYKYGQTSSSSSASSAYVELTLKPEAVSKFAEATKKAASESQGRNYIAIVMDGQAISAPTVSKEINSETCIIEGNFTPETAQELANQIKSGQLPFELNVISKETVGAELGADALPTSLKAAGIGLLIIMLFMIIMYRMSGLLASIALAIYVGLISLVLGVMRVNLSLSGIAGIITSLGMAVDANVIIFERMKEELKLGKTIKASVDSGFNKAFSAILDSNVTTIISCVVLYLSGIGTIRGFAVTLGIGVVISMFTAIVVTKLLLKQLVNFRFNNRKLFCA